MYPHYHIFREKFRCSDCVRVHKIAKVRLWDQLSQMILEIER